VVPPVVIPPIQDANCKPILIFDYIGNGGAAVFKYKLCGDVEYSYHTFNLLPSPANYYTYPVYADTGFPYKCLVENSMELVSGDITITNNRYIYSGTSCTNTVVTPPTFRAWHFSSPGRPSKTNACANRTFTNVFYTNYQVGSVPAMGSQMYLNQELTSKVAGGNSWFNLQEALMDDNETVYRIDTNGILAEYAFCNAQPQGTLYSFRRDGSQPIDNPDSNFHLPYVDYLDANGVQQRFYADRTSMLCGQFYATAIVSKRYVIQCDNND